MFKDRYDYYNGHPPPSVTNTTNNSRCGAGTIVLSATANAGTLNWFATSSGGTSLGIGATFTTPNISNTTTYYVEATSGTCSSTRTPVVATITSPPSVTNTTNNSRCGAGTVVLSATASAGTLNWFATSSGGTSLGTGATFTTPNISNTTTYYVEAVNGSCSSTRTPVVATITSPPSVTNTTNNSRCGAGTVVLSATASAGTLNWFATSSGGTNLGTGATFTTPNISNTTTYYVEAVNGTCSSTRMPVLATVYPGVTAPIVGKITESACNVPTGSVVLSGLPTTGTWTINPSKETRTGASTTITKLGVGTHNFTVTNDKGCTSPPSTVDMTCLANNATCLTDLINNIPSGFTPGDNGVNDFFDPEKYLILSGCSKNITAEGLYIYNVWDEMIFKAEPYNRWDGRTRNQDKVVPNGVYGYKFTVNVDGKRQAMKGTIHLFAD